MLRQATITDSQTLIKVMSQKENALAYRNNGKIQDPGTWERLLGRYSESTFAIEHPTRGDTIVGFIWYTPNDDGDHISVYFDQTVKDIRKLELLVSSFHNLFQYRPSPVYIASCYKTNTRAISAFNKAGFTYIDSTPETVKLMYGCS